MIARWRIRAWIPWWVQNAICQSFGHKKPLSPAGECYRCGLVIDGVAYMQSLSEGPWT